MTNSTESPKPNSVPLRDVLEHLGFRENPSVYSDRVPGLTFDFGNFKLDAAWVTSPHSGPIVLISGVMRSSRAISEIAHELPREVESIEQGMALLAWMLDRGAGGSSRLAIEPPWLEQGRKLRHLLPWERDKAAYAARPHCDVERDWARLALKKLREAVQGLEAESTVTISFDGAVLGIRTEAGTIAMPAKGKPWPKAYEIPAGRLHSLPKRLMRDPIDVSVWKNRLGIDNYRYEGVVEVADQPTPLDSLE